MEQKKQTHIMYGFVAGISMAVLGLVLYLMGVAFKPGMQYLVQLPFLLCIILNAMAYSKANDGFVTFGNVFGSGFKLSMIVGIVTMVWSIICIYVFPEMKTKAIAASREVMAKNPQMTDDQIEMALNITKKYWNAIMIAGSIFGALIYGAIFSLIGAAVAQKKGERPMASDF